MCGSRLFDPTNDPRFSTANFWVHQFSTACHGSPAERLHGHETSWAFEHGPSCGEMQGWIDIVGPMSCELLNFQPAKIPSCPSQSVKAKFRKANPRESRDQRFANLDPAFIQSPELVASSATMTAMWFIGLLQLSQAGLDARFHGQVWTWPNYARDRQGRHPTQKSSSPNLPSAGFDVGERSVDPVVIPLVFGESKIVPSLAGAIYVPFLFQ